MPLLTFVVVLILASRLLADQGTPLVRAAQPIDKPCCVPGIWEGTVLDLKGDLRFSTLFAQDASNQIEGSWTTDRTTGKLLQQQLIDHKKGVMYTVTMDGPCRKEKPTTEFLGSCFDKTNPAVLDHQYQGNGTLGGPGGLVWDAWSVQFKGGINITIALARDNCVPVLESVTGYKGAPSGILLLFNDVKTTITDKKLLEIPPACLKDSLAAGTGVVG